MKLTLKKELTGCIVGVMYNITWNGWSWSVVNECGEDQPVSLDSFESIKERFSALRPTKRLTSKPHKGYTTDLLMTENYFIYYQHSKGSYYNVFGNHYKYYHDIITGEYIPDDLLPASAFKEKTITKERVTVADWNKLFKDHPPIPVS